MTLYLDNLALLKDVAGHATLVEEKWGHLKFSGSVFPELITKFKGLKSGFSLLGFNNILRLTVNCKPVADDDLEMYEKINVSDWSIDLNKLPLIAKKDGDGWHYNIFLKVKNCAEWLRGSNPLSKTYPFNEFCPLRIIADDMTDTFGGARLQFLSPAKQTLAPLTAAEQQVHDAIKLPSGQALREHTHFITIEEVEVNPVAFIAYGALSSDLKKIFLYKACLVLSLYLLNEYYSNDKVVIDGIKRVVLKLDDGSAEVTEKFYFELISLVSWMYEDRVSVRRKLFNERLSLDRDEKDCLLVALTKNITSAAAQAKERYNFVITERKDAYVKELRELLKDIRTQSELYSGKIRTLLSNFLRDLLAAIVLVGFTLFTKFTDNEKLVNQELLQYVFHGLSIYYLGSIFMQTVVDVVDIKVSKKEILYWKNATNEQLSETVFKDHINKSLKGRRTSLYFIYPLIVFCYMVVSFTCYKYPHVFKSLIEREAAKKANVVRISVPVGTMPSYSSERPISQRSSVQVPRSLRTNKNKNNDQTALCAVPFSAVRTVGRDSTGARDSAARLVTVRP